MKLGGILGVIVSCVGCSVATFFLTRAGMRATCDEQIKEEIAAYQTYVKTKLLKANSVKEHDIYVKNEFLDEIINKTEKLDMTYRTDVRDWLDGFFIETKPSDEEDEEDVEGKKDMSLRELRERAAKERKAYNKLSSDYREVEDSDEAVEDFMKQYAKEHGIEYDEDEDEDNADIVEDLSHQDTKKEGIRKVKDGPKEPYIISEELHNDTIDTPEFEDWDTEFLYYHYYDEILYDGGGAVVDAEDCIGEEALEGVELGDYFVVRNESLMTDYEVSVV